MDLLGDKLILIIQAVNSPKVTIIRGSILDKIGNIYISLVRNIIHLIELPAKIDIVPSNIVGTIILICS